jgi:hypothetical protein
MRQLRQREVGDHESDDAGGHRQRQERGDGLGDARPGERAHAAQEHDAGGADHDHGSHQALRLPEHPGRRVAGKARLRRKQEEDRHGECRRRHDAHDAALETAPEKRRHRIGAELAHERRKQHPHENETGAPADAEAHGVEPDDEERAGQGQEAGAAQRRHREHQPVEEGGYPAPAGEIVCDLARAASQADHRV